MKSRLWHIAAVLLLSLMLATLVDAFYLELERQEYRQSLDTRIQREGDNLQQLTLSSKGMGAVQLAGRLNREIQQSSLLERGAEPERSSAGVGAGGEGQSCLCYQ